MPKLQIEQLTLEAGKEYPKSGERAAQTSGNRGSSFINPPSDLPQSH